VNDLFRNAVSLTATVRAVRLTALHCYQKFNTFILLVKKLSKTLFLPFGGSIFVLAFLIELEIINNYYFCEMIFF